ncbi:MAG: hypothetical protein QXX98_03565, partial [Thermoplasmata archaeon]
SIIAWLDDDDLFSRDKLQRIYDIFSNHDVGFYHNDYLTSDEPVDFSKIGLKEGNFKILNYPYRWKGKELASAAPNMSSIAMKKEILLNYSKYMAKVDANQDLFCFLLALISKTKIVIDKNRLTFYRLHDNNTSQSKDLRKFIELTENLFLPALRSQLKLAREYESKVAINFFAMMIFDTLSYLGIVKKDKKLVVSAFKYFRFYINKGIFKLLVADFLFLLGSNYPYKRVTKFLHDKTLNRSSD